MTNYLGFSYLEDTQFPLGKKMASQPMCFTVLVATCLFIIITLFSKFTYNMGIYRQMFYTHVIFKLHTGLHGPVYNTNNVRWFGASGIRTIFAFCIQIFERAPKICLLKTNVWMLSPKNTFQCIFLIRHADF